MKPTDTPTAHIQAHFLSSHKQGRSHDSVKHPFTLQELNNMLTVNKKKKKKDFAFTGFTHEKEETLYICQVNIYTIIDIFFFFFFEDETDSMLVLLTRYCMR